jgi:ergothioneine biosynthesis protein EgtB
MLSEHSITLHATHAATAASLKQRLLATRARSVELAAPLSDEDQVVQAMDDASPTKWHLAHTTWFFEKFILEGSLPGYTRFDDDFHYCFNSYYVAAGPRHPRPYRGLLTRPSVQQVRDYRDVVDRALAELFEHYGDTVPEAVADLLEIGINHEQQHQELLLTDILSLFAQNPLHPAYSTAYAGPPAVSAGGPSGEWVSQPGGIRQVGSDGRQFHFDNETPAHAVLLQPYRLSPTLVSNGAWLDFIADGGYETPALWLSDGWATVQTHAWDAPGYWREIDGQWHQMTLAGLVPVSPDRAVSHVSFYEAEAFARWSGKRLPSEFEWEVVVGNNADRFGDAFGHVWQWTASSYAPYPGYQPAAGTIGEYNGKFMVNQYVLRGSSHATAADHSRTTYRNFFYPSARWQFTGLRLAEDIA